ncbi:ACP S-malonyltransferase [Paenibacillus sp. FSL R7-0179]|uniref:ACP S-malonyltransferase n=1 Tax=Paenibacillus sp. FSL R7-0179 TaxID=2921672 RepID=UPI0030F53763
MLQVGLIFPGQGSQYVGMGKWLLENYSEARPIFEEANEELNFDIKTLCMEGSLAELSQTKNAQPAILTVSTIAHHFYMSEVGIKPKFVAGHSLGEYSALVAAGSLEFNSALQIVRQRGLFMEEASSDKVGSMFSVTGVEKEWIEHLCEKISTINAPVNIACYNTSKQYIISTHRHSAPKLLDVLDRNHVSYMPLNVSGPFHSPLMHGAADKLSPILNQFSFQNWHTPIISNVTGRPYHSSNKIKNGLLLQMTRPVMWESSIRFMFERKVDVLIELGPQSILKKMTKDISVQLEAYAFDNYQDLSRFQNGRMRLYRSSVFINLCLAIVVSTPSSNKSQNKYEADVLCGIRKLKQMNEELQESGTFLTPEQMREAYRLVYYILQTKEVSEEELSSTVNELECFF